MPADQPITSLKLRNYVLQPGTRTTSHRYFNEHFVQAMAELERYTLGQFAVASLPDNFCWLRDFADWQVRSAFLPAFYPQEPAWKAFGSGAHAMMEDSDNA